MNDLIFKRLKLTILLAILLCITGLYISIDLSLLHYRVYTDPQFDSFCVISDSLNCETVAESPYSVFLGLPVSVWGALAYLVMGFLVLITLFAKEKELPFALLLLFSAISVIVSVILALISYCIICSLCILCSATYLINLSLLLLLVFSIRWQHFPWRDTYKRALKFSINKKALLLCCLLGLVGIITIYPKYWVIKPKQETKNELSGNTRDSSPWVGSSNPELTVIEYSDYLCPFCRRSHIALRKWVDTHPGKIKLVHRQFPLDELCNRLLTRPFHPGACALAKAAYCAGEQGRFWQMNDYFIYKGTPSEQDLGGAITKLAETLVPDARAFKECLVSTEANEAIKKDIEEALSLNIEGTPSYVVNNQVYLGMLPQEMLQQFEEKK